MNLRFCNVLAILKRQAAYVLSLCALYNFQASGLVSIATNANSGTRQNRDRFHATDTNFEVRTTVNFHALGSQPLRILTFLDVHRPVVWTDAEIDFVLPVLSRVNLAHIVVTDDGSTDFSYLDSGEILARTGAISLAKRNEALLLLCNVLGKPPIRVEFACVGAPYRCVYVKCSKSW